MGLQVASYVAALERVNESSILTDIRIILVVFMIPREILGQYYTVYMIKGFEQKGRACTKLHVLPIVELKARMKFMFCLLLGIII